MHFRCEKLHATISLEVCAMNREKALLGEPCCKCNDWQTWGLERIEEVAVVEPLKKASPLEMKEEKAKEEITLKRQCPECKKETAKLFLGLCKGCHNKKHPPKKRGTAIQTEEKPITTNSTVHERIYLSCPYTSDLEKVSKERAETATRIAARLRLNGKNVFSSITYAHEIGKHGGPVDFKARRDMGFSFIDIWATHLYVIMLEGWDKSSGVQAEIKRAQAQEIPIVHIMPM